MSNAELLTAGIKLMVCGMGIVFVFLVIMIGAMNLLRVVLAPFADALDEKKAAAPAKQTDDLAVVAAAVAAVDLERNH
ncbi:MAG: OadG family protein [Victivallaceae bacterium]|nr:OadG family protein [Victivallaceae bacterium]